MRTTLTIDDDVAIKLKAEARRTGQSFKEALNMVLRAGLTVKKSAIPAKRFVVTARHLEPVPGVNYDNVEELLDQLEGPLRR